MTFWIPQWETLNAANSPNWFLKPRFFKTHFSYLQERFPLDIVQESSQWSCSEDNFTTLM